MSKRLGLGWALIVATCSFASVAQAEEPVVVQAAEAAEIQLKNGSSMRGTLVAVEPGQRVIVIVAGEQSVIPWAEIAKVVGGPKDSSAPAAVTVASPPPAAPTKGMPLLRIESNWQDLELSRVDGDIGAGVQNNNTLGTQTLSKYICRAPCDKLVDGRDGHRFFITGPGMYPSPHFRLDGHEGVVTARVHGTSLGRFVTGVALLGFGGVLGLGGGMFMGLSYLGENETPSADNPDPQATAETIRKFGGVTLGIGLGAVITGVILVSSGGRTTVELVKTGRGKPVLVLDQGVLRF